MFGSINEKQLSFIRQKAPLGAELDTARGFSSRLLELAVLLAFLLAVPASALAIPLDVFFQGIRPANEPQTAFGIGATQAINARDNFGVSIITGVVGMSAIGNIAVTQDPPTDFSSTPGTDPFNRASSIWDIENVSGSAFEGAAYLIFTHTDPFTTESTFVEYIDENVGLTIDAAAGWSIIMASSGGNDFYYPAILLDRSVVNPLDGNIAPDASVDILINYAVNQPLIELGTDTNRFALPRFEQRFTLVVIPEPGTAMLLGIGLAGLASVRRKA